MRCRKLKTILNTGYIVHSQNTKLCVASHLCSDLISFDPISRKLSYALGYPSKNVKPDSNPPKAIWEALEKLIECGEIDDILNGDDEIENPMNVYYYDDDGVKSAISDGIGYPNITSTGILMHDNTFFSTFEEARQNALKNKQLMLKWTQEKLIESNAEMLKLKDKMFSLMKDIETLKGES